MKYCVRMTEQAAADLRSFFEYIAYDLLAGQNALAQLDRLNKPSSPWRKCPNDIIVMSGNRGKDAICA